MPIPEKRRKLKSPPQRTHRFWGPPGAYTESTGGKATETWNWPPTSTWCSNSESMEMYLHYPTRLQRVYMDNLTQWPSHSAGNGKVSSKTSAMLTTATSQQAQHVGLCSLACTQHRDVIVCSSRHEWRMALAVVGCQVTGPTWRFMEQRTLQFLMWHSRKCIKVGYNLWLRKCIK
jgi:hypothetical protein